MGVQTFANIGIFIGSLAAAISIVVGVVVFRRQMNAQVFLEYTKRYEEIMSHLSQAAREARLDLDGDPPPTSPELSLAVLRYLNLCSEEFYLCRRRYLSTKIWKIWEAELRRTLRSPLFRREWNKLHREFDSYPEFHDYVENTLREDARAG